MPSEQATWLIAVPDNSDAIGLYQSVNTKLKEAKAIPGTRTGELHVPSLKVNQQVRSETMLMSLLSGE
jgi:V-type H+-transporting ATPase subunit C